METSVGRVTHYFPRIGVAVLSLTGEINMDDTLHFLGRSTDLIQKVWSMEINHQKIQMACPGMEVAIRVAEPVHCGDTISLISGVTPEEIYHMMLTKLEES